MYDNKENEKNSLESIKDSVNTASKITSAVKSGQSIAGVTKGLAMSGPAGIAVSVLLQNKDLAKKILLVVIVLFSLPILVMMSLPSILF